MPNCLAKNNAVKIQKVRFISTQSNILLSAVFSKSIGDDDLNYCFQKLKKKLKHNFPATSRFKNKTTGSNTVNWDH